MAIAYRSNKVAAQRPCASCRQGGSDSLQSRRKSPMRGRWRSADKTVVDRSGRLDVIVNNVEISRWGTLANRRCRLGKHLYLDLLPVLYMCRSALPHIAEGPLAGSNWARRAGGVVLRAGRQISAYAAPPQRPAVAGTRSLALEEAKHGITAARREPSSIDETSLTMRRPAKIHGRSFSDRRGCGVVNERSR